ncbi:DNA-formamidopyrimidine glycosylase family protein [Nocardioides sp. CFH 31398]|uniref:Fpg/Nei family DNA glycosylase n=1 Tax=Nocardioides sp. CFH 31398 TaxID=2919579 RepID=UPI001F05741D|nr:DNA-formamidopyrimidine glycosylase family protein [Nocardioides sp. CFH 31398]MCH1868536.1 Fpg/Nei family DNA glycosylase [Nocardioides sp. CFH 31398]
MPEGHTIHRLANRHRRLLRGRTVEASSPQGRFAEGAALIDGARLRSTEAWGKHLFHHYADPADDSRGASQLLHVHLGLYGKFQEGRGEPEEPRGALRLRLVSRDEDDEDDVRWLDLRGPIACELLTPPEREAVLSRLGPDPLRKDTDPTPLMTRLGKSRAPLATLLMDQSVVAGIGNVYRAEILFRHGLDPYLPGREADPFTLMAAWNDLVELMKAGVRSGRIVTTEPEHRERFSGRARRTDAHYVYRRHGLPCRVCGAEILLEAHGGRKLYWCPSCQPPGGGRRAV